MDYGILSGLRPNARPGRDLTPLQGIAEVRAYWEGLRQGGGIPARSSLDPRGISGALDRVFLAERIGPGLVQIRLAGNSLSEIAGMDPRGLPLSCLFPPEGRATLARVIERVFEGPVAADLHLQSNREIARPLLDGRMILLPLLDAAGDCRLMLGCLALQGETGRAPRRFDILNVVEERLRPEPAVVSAPPPPVSSKVHSDPPGRGHLRLVYSAT
ncbi:PAS domain-containing protein [Tabrizicola sp.]|uniref:PAS domain-containing protein n=1 Tax=Tabrizicola sp. TaxID=2005166 RepID=UPI00286BFC4B|nr:PAS domain-containing protein [Tabrizicola sp.]